MKVCLIPGGDDWRGLGGDKERLWGELARLECKFGDGGVLALTSDEDPTDEDGDMGIGDSTGVLVSLGDEIFSEGIVIILEIEVKQLVEQ
ncbi:hypothetical protein Tco_0948755 [Tanacetum coccineum]